MKAPVHLRASLLSLIAFVVLMPGIRASFAQDDASDVAPASQNAELDKLRARMDGITPVRFAGGAWQGETDQSAVAISPDGKQLAISGTDAVIRNIADWQKVATIPAANWIQWPTGGKFLFLSGGMDDTQIAFRRHALDGGTEDKIYNTTGKWMKPEFISRDGSILSANEFISAGDSALVLWNTATGEILRAIRNIDRDTLYSGVHALSADGKTVAFATQEISDRTPSGGYSIADGRRVFIGPADREGADVRVATDFPPKAIAFLPGERGLVYLGVVPDENNPGNGNWKIFLKLLDPRAPEKQPQAAVASLDVGDRGFETITVSPSGKYTAIADHSGRVWVYELPSLKKLWTAGFVEIQQTENIVFSPDEKMLIISGYDPAPRLYSLPEFKEIIPYPGHTSPVLRVAFSADGKTLTSFSSYHICHWDTATMKMLDRIAVPTGFAIISAEPSGHHALCIDQTTNTLNRDAPPRVVKVLDAASGRVVSEMKATVNNFSEAAWLPQGNVVMMFYGGPANMMTKIDYLKDRILSRIPLGRKGQVDSYATEDGFSFLVDTLSQANPDARASHLYECFDLNTGDQETVPVQVKGNGTLVWNGRQYHLLEPQPMKKISPDLPVLPPLRGVAKDSARTVFSSADGRLVARLVADDPEKTKDVQDRNSRVPLLVVYDAGSMKPRCAIPLVAKCTAANFSLDGTKIAIAGEDGSLEIWPLPK